MIALIGLGEVGRVLAEDLRPADVTAWDTAFADPRSPASRTAVALGIESATSADAAVRDAELVISAVTAAHDLAAAEAVARAIGPGAWFLDLNSAAPTQKCAAAAVIESARGRYVEAAVMSPIEPKRLAAPMLLGGQHAASFLGYAGQLGFTGLEVYAAEVGPAAATKLCRSVVVKGLEALLLESMMSARAWGVEDRVLASLSNLLPGTDWPTITAYMMSRALQHGARRAEEMDEAALTVAATGIEPLLATATARRQAWAASFGHAAAAPTVADMVDRIRATTPIPAEPEAAR